MRRKDLVMAIFVLVAGTGCGGSPTAPSGPQVFEGSLVVQSVFDNEGAVFTFTANRAGTLSATVDWTNSGTDIDAYLFPGTCRLADFQVDTAGCGEDDFLAQDVSLDKPASFSVAVTNRAYTLLVVNLSFASETATYRIEIN